MNRKTNKALIGAFVVGAVVIFAVGLSVIGSGKIFRTTRKFVLFFDGSIKGLNVGAAVNFRGVKIGTVSDIRLVLNPQDYSVFIPVVIEIDPTIITGIKETFPNPKGYLRFVERGMRARLDILSFVTGQLVVSLDFYPDKPARFVGLSKEYPEIPTLPSPIDELSKTLNDLPIKQIAEKTERAIEGIERFVNSDDFKESAHSINLTLKDIRELTVFELYELNSALKEIKEAARSARVFIEYLEQHPEALLKGKARPQSTRPQSKGE
jgi:paraquat-inducible protein B